MRTGGRLQRTGGFLALRTPAAGWRAGLGPVVLTLLLANQAGRPGQTAAAQPGPRAASPSGTPDHVLQQRLRACAACARAKRKCDGSRASCELAQVLADAAGARARDEGHRLQDFDADAPELANVDVAAAYEVRRGKVAGRLLRQRRMRRVPCRNQSMVDRAIPAGRRFVPIPVAHHASMFLTSFSVGRGGCGRK